MAKNSFFTLKSILNFKNDQIYTSKLELMLWALQKYLKIISNITYIKTYTISNCNRMQIIKKKQDN